MRIVGVAMAAFFAIVVVTVLGGSWYQVSEGYRGVVTRNGAVSSIARPGMGLKTPVIDGVYDISVQTHIEKFTSDDGQGIAAYTFDQQEAKVVLSVNWSVPSDDDSVRRVYTEYGSEEDMVSKILRPRVLEYTKNVFGTLNAAVAIKERERLNNEIEGALVKSLAGLPIKIDGVQIENITYSEAYEKVAEERSQAEVEVLKSKQKLEDTKIQAEITVTKAEAERDSKIATATGEAESRRLLGIAEATAITAKGKALVDNPALVDLIKAERWDGKLPTTMLPNGTVPFIEANKSSQ
jgi:regulator of protease activity HflC (stomatin/prohibitin superfamily)